MNISAILTAVIVVGGVGLFLGIFLGIASIVFKVEVDEKEEAVLGVLPGNNCGGCGYPGCSGLAAAISKGEAPVNACPVGGEAVGKKVAEIMGVEAGETVRMTAFVKCSGNCDNTFQNYEYTGVEDCSMVKYVPDGGAKSCNYGCLGFGNCIKACQFGAISIVNGIAAIDKEKCKACGKCVAACPKKLIELIPYNSQVMVACSSKDKGPVTMKACKTGCIGCGLCARNCPNSAVTVENFHAHIDQTKCVGCLVCVEKCPKKIIRSI
jgi:Na+-translocating ferredoxin:NAD+ oxidoreductase RNF subunit RnfB